MKRLSSVIVLAAVAIGLWPGFASAADQEGVALAIIYDTSGSMRDAVPGTSGRATPKYIIANRALIAVARQLQAFTTNTSGGEKRTLHTALFTFQGERPKEVIKLGVFDPEAFEKFANNFSSPNGNTPLGNTLRSAAQAVLESPLPRKHVLIITDGINTAGPRPEDVLPQIKTRAADKQKSLEVHFVAFDVAAKHFDMVKKLGATVVAAADEKQLNTQLDFILKRKILLEDEEPPKSR
jgi:VWA domain-containing protein